METTAVLVIVFVSIGIGLLFFIKMGILTNILGGFISIFDSWMSILRGILVDGLWVVFGIFFGIATMMIISPKCATPQGALYCGVLEVATVAVLTTSLSMIFSTVPFVHIDTPTVDVGKISVTHTTVVPFSEAEKEIADNVVSCFAMFGSGKYDPLTGVDPPNPRTCFVLHIVTDHDFDMTDINYWMLTHEYPSGEECQKDNNGRHVCELSYLMRLGELAGDKEHFGTYIPIKGTWAPLTHTGSYYHGYLFIKYYDAYGRMSEGPLSNGKTLQGNLVMSSQCYDKDCGFNGDCPGLYDKVVLCKKSE